MRLARICLSAVLLLVATPSGAHAWSFDVHRWLAEKAIPLLPAEIRPFFERHRAFVIEHAIDPDLWRNVGFLEEPPRHFLDMDAYGPYPFTDLPRDYAAAVQRFGKDMVQKNGLLPWRAAEIHGQLVRAFRQYADGTSSYAGFESELMRRYASRVRIAPKPIAPIREARDAIFESLLSGFLLVEPILAVDRKAAQGREEYDVRYYEQFFSGTQMILQRRLGEAAGAIAAMIAGAWEAAGRPAVPLDRPTVNRKVRRQ
jgi:hypothetical protein